MITINGNAKINLTLDILGKRTDGYHEVSMIMQSINLFDTLTLQKLDEQKIILHGDVRGVARMQDNLIYKAAQLFLDTYKIHSGVEINLTKRIPIAAGLAGGSTDAAATLRGLDKLFETNLSVMALCEMGAKLGSDIPFCIMGGTMLATGRGEILSQVAAMPQTNLVLVKPKFDVSTAWVYKNYHEVEKTVVHPDNKQMRKALLLKDIDKICNCMGNVLEYVTIGKYPQIEEIKQKLYSYGAKAAMMSGSGPTVFAVAEDKKQAEEIAARIRNDFTADVFVTETAAKNF